jgi:hypothetical protein
VVAAAVLGVLSPDIPLHVGPLAAVAAGAGVSLARERSSE